jgi:hypothetical protein
MRYGRRDPTLTRAAASGFLTAVRIDPVRTGVLRADWVDMALICIFLLGLYSNYTIQIATNVPFPSAPSGIAGLILLWRRRNQISAIGLGGLVAVLLLYLASILCATNINYLPRRTNGLIQLSYSIVIGYAVFLTVTQASRQQIAGLFLGFASVILVGCLLENYGGLRSISDDVRKVLYSRGIYENDLRDILYYHRVRPKFFASEPASVTFCYSLFTFVWMVVSTWRWKLVLYVILVGLGMFAMPGPTLLLMLLLTLPYMLFLASRKAGRLDAARLLLVALAAVFFLGSFVVLAQSLFPTRLEEVTSGNDPSFFYRVRGPALAGIDIMSAYPLAGAGLTGEPFIESRVVDVYVRSPAYSATWQVVKPATELLINYFWLHWIYFGLVWGVVLAAAVTVWFVVLGVPSPAFCWMVWAILGQASGAYVGPTCWAVLFLAAAAAVLHQRQELQDKQRGTTRAPAVDELSGRLANLGLSRPGASKQWQEPAHGDVRPWPTG